VSVGIPHELRTFKLFRPDVEAVLQRCGLGTFDLLLIDATGSWTRWVFSSEETAVVVAEDLDIPLHREWDDRMTKRMNKRDHWNEPGGKRRAL
jgi:hypothetical protein